MTLMMARAFELGYRRYEWKCDALNSPSRLAALRFGFVFEGIFRQATVRKGRNRDTAWYSIIDKEWPSVRRALETWLAPANFDERGRQREALSTLTRAIRGGSDQRRFQLGVASSKGESEQPSEPCVGAKAGEIASEPRDEATPKWNRR